MSLIGMVIVILCFIALFGGLIRAVGGVAIALVKYVIFPVALLTALLAIVKYGF